MCVCVCVCLCVCACVCVCVFTHMCVHNLYYMLKHIIHLKLDDYPFIVD